jgi:5-methyltetrahydrofolate--homocysteine methyltransferase
MPTSPFISRLQSGQVLIADGATGTNLQKRGLQPGQLNETWSFEHPEEIVRLHREFIQAGSDILLTNTFQASALRLAAAGMVGKAREVNTRAVELARQAIGQASILVGGSVGPTGQLLKPYGPLSEEQMSESFAEQIQALAEAGVDFLVIETHFDLKEAGLALKAARACCSLPAVVSFSYDRGTRTMMGVKPSQMAAEFVKLGADVLGINCGRSLEDNLQALKELRQATSLPVWFKPNAGLPHADAQGNSIYDVTPEQMGAQAAGWIASGAQVVGGCCGTSPEHLAQIALSVRK